MIATTKIKKLTENTINKIAAGEVIERPASVVKELVENSIDACARTVEITIECAGYNVIKIQDDGFGMSKQDLENCVYRHTTSKLDESNIHDLQYMGFRGEALSSIISVSRTTIACGHETNEDNSWQIFASGDDMHSVSPIPRMKGCIIEVRDLFCFVPARLKFLKGEQAEAKYILQIVQTLAIANPEVNFILKNEKKTLLDTTKQIHGDGSILEKRIVSVLGEDISDNMMRVDDKVGFVSIEGYASLPTMHRRQSDMSFVFVNKRAVKDKSLIVALKIAYADVMVKGRYPVTCLFLKMPTNYVDVNVHPAKAEVRFRDDHTVKRLVINAIRKSIHKHSHNTTSTLSNDLLQVMKQNSNDQTSKVKSDYGADPLLKTTIIPHELTSSTLPQQTANNHTSNIMPQTQKVQSDKKQMVFNNLPNSINISKHDIIKDLQEDDTIIKVTQKTSTIPDNDAINHNHNEKAHHPNVQKHVELDLGHACAQLNNTYIVAQNDNGIAIIDQHAAHERIMYEDMKSHHQTTQMLLIPEMVKLDEEEVNILMNHKDKISEWGIVFSKSSVNTILVTEIPSILENANIRDMMENVAQEIINTGEEETISNIFEHILETRACKNSLKAGTEMSIDEMNALLRMIEKTTNSGQCNHGRPTYVKLKWPEIEKLFGRR